MAAIGALLGNAISIRPTALGTSRADIIWEGHETASQTFKVGAALIYDTNPSGALKIAAAKFTSGLVGFAAEDANGTAGARRLYYPALPGVVFEGTFDDSATGGTVAGRHTMAITDWDAGFYLLNVDSNGIWYVDNNGGTLTNGTARIVGPTDRIGGVGTRVFFTVDPRVTIYST